MNELLVSFLADWTLVILIAMAVGFIGYDLYRRRSLMPLHVVAVAALTSLFVAKCISVIYQPSTVRPFMEAGAAAGAAFVDNPGFPSDHALLGTVLAVAVYGVTRRRNVALIMLLIVVAMDIGRVLALVHTPLDVIAGSLFGLLGAIWYVVADKEFALSAKSRVQ